jgi:CDP-glycerol glycerophosphotransferase (TagB/SpsB family)
MNQQEFKQLNNKVLAALKAHPDIIKDNINVIQHSHPFFGDVWQIGHEVYSISNNGDEATWQRVQ